MAPFSSSFLALASLLVLVVPNHSIDNGLGITPPRGWRSWNTFDCTSPSKIITDTKMRDAMLAVLDTSRKVDGKPASLKDLGFGWVSMDDGWQQCNCSTRQDLDPTLPKCSPNDCSSGKCTWHNKTNGRPMVNQHRFPNMHDLVSYGHSLGLKVGGYLNNCICMEGSNSPTHYEKDVEWFLAMGFDEVKIDSCGSSKNVSRFVELFNASGKPIRVENCHNGVPDANTGSCPMNFFRSGGDISPNFPQILGEAYSTIPFSDLQEPLSRPGCWAYPDMLEVGNFGGDEPQRSDEERSHFGLWCIVSSPLILGLNLTDHKTVDRVWPIITNKDALAVNEAWAGHPGTLVKSYPAKDLFAWQIGQDTCDKDRSTGWRLADGCLYAPGSTEKAPLCVDGSDPLPDEPSVWATPCPPPTAGAGQVNCGLTIQNCSLVKGKGLWKLESSGLLVWQRSQADQPAPQCLQVLPQVLIQKGDGQRRPAMTHLIECPKDGQPPPVGSRFVLTPDGQLQVADALPSAPTCLTSASLNGAQLWSKPMSGSRAAALLVNVLSVPQRVLFPLTDIPMLSSLAEPSSICWVRDVWAQQTSRVQRNEPIELELRGHASAFFIISCEEETFVL
eukprot:TRINITY_DN71522_c0_g1_i1.p1 TRINITY_DN71522_c0_g1~~TRINITY_DN71522_c0_g1_i1.p1  ORF type:complete len:615 (+),score=55.17 TRINITY_DN71522_c0_g1_i1:204-2048(+)